MSFLRKKTNNHEQATNNVSYLRRIKKMDSHMKKNEEYVENRGRDWLFFIVSLVGMIALLIFLPEWIWVSFPFVFTSLAGAVGRL